MVLEQDAEESDDQVEQSKNSSEKLQECEDQLEKEGKQRQMLLRQGTLYRKDLAALRRKTIAMNIGTKIKHAGKPIRKRSTVENLKQQVEAFHQQHSLKGNQQRKVDKKYSSVVATFKDILKEKLRLASDAKNQKQQPRLKLVGSDPASVSQSSDSSPGSKKEARK